MERVLFCTDKWLLAWDWSRGRFGGVCAFADDREGRRQFAAYLQASGPVARYRPLRILVDLLEEEFHATTVPWVRGRDHAAVLQRAMAKYFRNGDLCSVQLQGRQEGGRRDRQVLVCGLGNASVLHRWLEILQHLRVPVQGLYSLPLVGQRVLSQRQWGSGPVLLISQQSARTLRQSFYAHGSLRFSRLTPYRTTLGDGGSAARSITTDINDTLSYLHNQRLLQRIEPLAVQIIANDALCTSLARNLPDDALLTCTLTRQADMARRIGITTDLPDGYSAGIFAHALLQRPRPASHYKSRSLRHFYHYHTLRKILSACTALLLLAAILFATGRYQEMRLVRDHASETSAWLQRYREQYRLRAGRIPAQQPTPAAIRDSVNAAQRIQEYAGSGILSALTGLAEAVNNHPHIKITRIRWQTAPQAGGDSSSDHRAAPHTALTADNHAQLLDINGDISGHRDNFRDTLAVFTALVGELQRSGRYHRVTVLKTPFDLNSVAALSGDSGTAARDDPAARPTFHLRLTRLHDPSERRPMSGGP